MFGLGMKFCFISTFCFFFNLTIAFSCHTLINIFWAHEHLSFFCFDSCQKKQLDFMISTNFKDFANFLPSFGKVSFSSSTFLSMLGTLWYAKIFRCVSFWFIPYFFRSLSVFLNFVSVSFFIQVKFVTLLTVITFFYWFLW